MNYRSDNAAGNLILVINPRHPFTKIGVFKNKNLVFLKSIKHDDADLAKFAKYEDQTEYRGDAIIKELKENDIDIEHIKLIISRGGLIKPVKSGIYAVNDKMITDLHNSLQGTDIVNIGGLVSDYIAKTIPEAKAIVADPVVVDEYEDVARITGLPEIKRRSIFHALNQKQAVRKYAKSIHRDCKELSLIVAHLGTGITVGAHKNGRVIDANMGYDGDGPFSPIRAGSIPTGDLIRLAFSGKYTEEELLKKVSAEGGLYAHFGTPNAIDIDKKVASGDKQAELIFGAMAYQVAKTIGSMYAVLSGKVDGIIITGAMAHSQWLVGKIVERIENMGKIVIYAGANDIETLAARAVEVLDGEMAVKEY
ncbi:MAG: butyrate kinase [Salinivirgaceae bacterium]|nr:MAG: butyrate kinase [Salinivirgaceae bacterium]